MDRGLASGRNPVNTQHLLADPDDCDGAVGAGAAGIILARELARDGRRVLLLESGAEQLEPETQALYVGERMKVLEIGPSGFPSRYSKLIGNPSITWHTLDIDTKFIQQAETGPNHILASNPYHYPVKDEAYNIVLSGQVMETRRHIFLGEVHQELFAKISGRMQQDDRADRVQQCGYNAQHAGKGQHAKRLRGFLVLVPHDSPQDFQAEYAQ